MTPEKVMAWVAVITLFFTVVGSVVGYILHQRDAAQAKELARMDTSLAAAWLKIDELREEKSNYWTRAEAEALRREFKQDIEKLGDKITDEIEKLGAQFRADIDRAVAARMTQGGK